MIDSKKEIKIGDEIPSLTKKANVGEPASGFPWGSVHNEEYARSIGLRGGLVPGIHMMGNIIDMLVRFFGKEWHTEGKIDIKFISGGVVHGEMITTRGIVWEKSNEDGGVRLVLEIWIEREDGTKAAVGTASCLVP